MINTPAFKPHLQVEVIPGEGVLILSEEAPRALRGRAYEMIVRLIDGRRDANEIVDALAGEVDAARVYYVLSAMESNGYLAEATAVLAGTQTMRPSPHARSQQPALPISDFVSPLRIRGSPTSAGIGFGLPVISPEIGALRADLEVRLHAVLAHLPAPMRTEGTAIIRAYSGGTGEFYRLFYLPVWSFLHWIPASARIALDPALVDDARTAQALGLFVHLWDDHLCDGQLRTDLLRIQIRTDAWHAYLGACHRLRARIAPGSPIVEEHVATYLAAIHVQERVTDIAAYCTRFTRQIAIWTVVPQLLGLACGGTSVAADLSRIVEAFSNAWRLIDDVQDVEDDLRAGVESAVWQCLDDAGRSAWAECRARSLKHEGLEPQSWAALLAAIQAPGCVPHLLALTNDWLDEAIRLAEFHRWSGLASELAAHRPSEHRYGVLAARGAERGGA